LEGKGSDGGASGGLPLITRFFRLPGGQSERKYFPHLAGYPPQEKEEPSSSSPLQLIERLLAIKGLALSFPNIQFALYTSWLD